jgi:hypothetical protein
MMGFFDWFLGRSEQGETTQSPLVANPKIENALSLQLLFPNRPRLESQQLTASLRRYHPSLAEAQFEVEPEFSARGTPLGLAGWGKHVIKLVGFDVPMPREVVERCVQPSHYGPDLKQKARAHQAHVIVYYAGYEASPLEQYVALAVVAGTLASHGAIVVVNESAHTSFPASPLAVGAAEGDALEDLRTLPLLLLYCGFVKMDGDPRGVWMRTYGNHLLGLPDLAHLAEGHHQGQMIFDLFSNVLSYLLSSQAHFDAGHTMQMGAGTFMRLRAPTPEEPFLDSAGKLFVAEFISEGEINRR